MPYKRFGNFIKWLANLFSKLKQITKIEKEQKNLLGKTGPTHPPTSPAWPRPTPAFVVYPRQGYTHLLVGHAGGADDGVDTQQLASRLLRTMETHAPSPVHSPSPRSSPSTL